MTAMDNPDTDPNPTDWAGAIAPDATLIELLAHGAVAALPEPYRAAASAIVLRIEDFPPDDILQAMDIESPFDLTGLYEGIPLTEKSVLDQPQQPDMIWLFRRAILDEWLERGDVGLGDLVTHVMVHELAHHFGWSDGDIARIDRWWE
ncbi:MAG: metallopeptidase family protein [Pseudorhodobacter sp.]|nr:metallopeptidase family protein [Pseudorhodobacter sp.]